MEIAFLCFYAGDVYRGAEMYVHELSNRLVKMGHSVVVYQHGPKFPSALYETGYLKSVWSLPKFIRPPEILLPTNGDLQSMYSRIWCTLHGAKLIIAGHSGLGRDDIINTYAFPNVFIGLTHHQKQWLRQFNPFVKMTVIHNGVDVDKFSANKTRHKNLFLCVAALVPEKRLHLAVQAVARIPNAKLTIVGNGPEKQNLLDLGEKLMPGRLVVTSSHPEKMPLMYKSASTFIFPTSHFESFGIVLIEAMAANIPVVATDDPIRKEIVGEAGLFVDPENIDLFTKTLINAEKKDWGNAPRLQAEKFSWTKIAAQYDELIKRLK